MNKKGQTLLLVIVFLGIILLISLSLVNYALNHRTVSRIVYSDTKAVNLAEAGIDKAVWCLNHAAECPAGYSGETNNLGSGQYTTNVVSVGQNYTVTSTGLVNGRTKILKVTVSQKATPVNASFFYGVQIGVGGIDMENNTSIQGVGVAKGNIYAMGTVQATQNQSKTEITGDAILALSSPTQDVSCDPAVNPLNTLSIGSANGTRYLAQSFVPATTEKMYSFDLKIAKHNSPTTTITMHIYSDSGNNPGSPITGSGQQINATIPNDSPGGWENGWTTQVFNPNTNPILQAGVKYWLVLVVSGSSSTKYWNVVRGADDTTYLNNTAKLDSDTTAMPLACTGGCDIAFRTNMGGITPTLKIGTIGGNAYSHTIDGGTIGGKAYYQTLLNTVQANGGSSTCHVGDNGPWCFGNSTDQPPQNMPISSAQIAQLEANAADGGTEPTNCTISGGTAINPKLIGPKKYDCDVTISDYATLNGTVWVNGNLTLSIGSTIKLANGYGSNSGVIIADYVSDPTSKGTIYFNNNTSWIGNDTPGTYIMGISNYKDPSGINDAVSIRNNLGAGIIYAPNGKVSINNGSSVKEVSAQKLFLSQNSSITYETGLASIIFTNGPGGSWAVQSKTWQEIK